MSDIAIKPARSDELVIAASLTGEAMNVLPEVTAVFGGNLERVQYGWRIAFTHMAGQIYLAKDGEEIVGVNTWLMWRSSPTGTQDREVR
jgi:hypothetical protein